METIFYRTRAELTAQMQQQMKSGLTCYRVRTACKCRPNVKNPEMYTAANQRNGVLIIGGDTVKTLLINCKACANENI
jgi:hypothetical protein